MVAKSAVILLVEDNPDHESLTLRCLGRMNVSHEVVVARDGAEALNIVFQMESQACPEGSLPTVVLLDLNLPKLNGLEVLQRIRDDSRTHRLPVVLFTSSREQRDLIRGYDLGVNSYVEKPTTFDGFSRAVQELGLYWLVLNEPPPMEPELGLAP